jgi:hypothetical protein
MLITKKDFERIKDLKTLDIQQCSFCQKINILNLGWKPFRELFCRTHREDYIICWEICRKVCLNIWGCEFYYKEQKIVKEKQATNRKYNLTNCYFCFKELAGASKKGVVKNRNNSSFWGLTERFISCLVCMKRKYYEKLEKEKQKTLNKYISRDYE